MINNSFNKILKNSAIVFSGNMGASILGLLSISLFTHSQGAEIFGYFVLFLTYIEVIDRVFNFQTWQAFIKYAIDFQERKESHHFNMLLKYTFLIDLFSLFVAFLVAFFATKYFIDFFNIPLKYENLVVLMSFSLLFNIVSFTTGVFRIFDEFKIQSKIMVYVALIKLILFIVIYFIKPTFEYFVYATIFSQFVGFILKIVYSKKILNDNNIYFIDIVKSKIDFLLFKKLKIISFIVYNNLDVAVRMVSRQLDTILIGKLVGAEAVGIYKIAKEITAIIARFTDPIYQTIYPELAKLLSRNNFEDAKNVSFKISLYLSVFSILFYFLFIIFGKYAISLAFGDNFIDAYNVVLVYYIAIFISIVTLPIVPILQALALNKVAFKNQLLATLIYAICIYPLIYFYGLYGASITYIIFYTVWSLLSFKTIYNTRKF